MPVVVLKIADYTYKISCQAGQEKRIEELAGYLDAKAKKLLDSVGGYIPENQLLAMISILTAQELFTSKRTPVEEPNEAIAAVLKELTARIQNLTQTLSDGE